MSMLKNVLNRAVGKITPQWLTGGISQLVHEDFMKAFSGACALIACADGKIDKAEEEKIRAYIRNLKELKSFDSGTVMRHFSEYVDLLTCDFEMGQKKVYEALKEIKGNQDSARILVRACCSIGASDGNFDPDEKRVVQDICNQLNIDSREFNL